MTEIDLDVVLKTAEAALEGLADGRWTLSERTLWISGSSHVGGPAHLFDTRGWGYLTGRGAALALDQDTAFRIQRQWASHVAMADPETVIHLVSALMAEQEAGHHQRATISELRAALEGARAVRPSNWDDDEDPEALAAWRAMDAALAIGSA